MDIQRILIQLHRDANERPEPFVDHAGVLRDSKTGRAINGDVDDDAEEESITMRGCPSSVDVDDIVTHKSILLRGLFVL